MTSPTAMCWRSSNRCHALGWFSGNSSLSTHRGVYHPPRCQPTWTSHGHTACGGAAMVRAWVATVCGHLTRSSPGSACLRSARVEPYVVPRRCRTIAPVTAEAATVGRIPIGVEHRCARPGSGARGTGGDALARPVTAVPLYSSMLAGWFDPGRGGSGGQSATVEQRLHRGGTDALAGARLPNGRLGARRVRTGDIWNSNSLVSWLLVRSGHDVGSVRPPPHGRAPGWAAGVAIGRM